MRRIFYRDDIVHRDAALYQFSHKILFLEIRLIFILCIHCVT